MMYFNFRVFDNFVENGQKLLFQAISLCFREYNLVGVLMGLAVYNSIILDLHFPRLAEDTMFDSRASLHHLAIV